MPSGSVTASGDLLVSSFVHLPSFPRASEALQALRKIASLVKPIMRARSFKIRELAEFYPSQTNLLGVCSPSNNRCIMHLSIIMYIYFGMIIPG
jgi:hypothetical protein